jgi:D-alanyl-D-alanine dipeptidase
MRFDIMKAYLKYKLGLTWGLPVFVIRNVQEIDNGEPLVDLRKLKTKLFFGNRIVNEKEIFLRKSVAEKIENAAKSLPKDTYFLIHDAFRTLQYQQQEWDKKYKYFKNLYPNETDEQITKRTRKLIADPRNGHGGHQTGGAVDISLCDKNGVEFDMGTPYVSTDQKAKTKSKVHKIAKDNRDLLCHVMKQNGFINYPNEWWHFCYGDRMWAAYTGKKTCFYGLTKGR